MCQSMFQSGSHPLPLRPGRDSTSPLVRRLWKLQRTHRLQSPPRDVRVLDIKLQQEAAFHPRETQVLLHRNEQSGQTWTCYETTELLETRAERTMKRRPYWLIAKEFPPTARVDWMKLLKPSRGRGVNGTFAQYVQRHSLILQYTRRGFIYLWHYRIFYLVILNLFLPVLQSLVSIADSHLDIIKQ